MTKEKLKIITFVKQHAGQFSDPEFGKKFGVTSTVIRGIRIKYGVRPFSQMERSKQEQSLDFDIKESKVQEAKHDIKTKYNELIKRFEMAIRERDAAISLKKEVRFHSIKRSVSKGTGEATAVVVASDWHIEEEVKSASVNGRNHFTLEIAKFRMDSFFSHAVKLLKKEQSAIDIKNLVIALLGDFISGNIHEELLESCQLRPIEAIMLVRDWIASGIRFILDETDVDVKIVCSVGNHTRITKKVHIAQERGNNLEYFMYHVLSDEFKDNTRVEFIIEDSYHTYVDVYATTIRFHHGHAIKYGGGVGGLTIPVNKAIAQWNKTRNADLDVFGHWHQQFDGGNFLCNGSIIGYNAFAVFIKAGFESPKQLFFLVDSKRGKTVVCPILFAK